MRSCPNPDGHALLLDGAEVAGSIAAAGLIATGEVRAPAARVEGQLNLKDATLSNPDGQALLLDAAHLTGGIFAEGLIATGAVRAHSARIEGLLNLEEARLSNDKGPALCLQSAYVQTVKLGSAQKRGDGPFDLREARVGSLHVESMPSDWVRLEAQGWSLGDVHGPLRVDPGKFASWLDTTMWFTQQPWSEIAAIYDRSGQPGFARRIRVGMERRATNQLPFLTRWLRHIFYGGTVGYGYHPFGVVLWLLAIGTVAFAITYLVPSGFILPPEMSISDDYPRPDPWAVALNTALPATAPAMSIPWQPATPWVQAILTLLKTGSWLLTALFLAGVTGILRK